MKGGEIKMSSPKPKNRVIKLRCYPDKEQLEQLPQLFGNARFVYNYMLRYQQFRYKHNWKHMSQFDMMKELTKLKKKQPFLKFSNNTSLRTSIVNLDTAYKRFFKHINNSGLPHFKGRKSTQTMTIMNKTNEQNSIHYVSRHYISFSKLGHLRTKGNVPRHNVKRATLIQTPRGHYYLSIVVENTKSHKKQTKRSIGIDMGLKNIMTLSNGVKYRSLRFKNINRKITIANRKLSRRRENAKKAVSMEEHYNKQNGLTKSVTPWYERKRVVDARRYLAKLYSKKANYRREYLQALSTKLVNQYDIIAIEDLKVRNMVKNHHLAAAIADQGWSMFRTMLQYKCDWYGKKLIAVKPQNTTQTCADCGYVMGSDDRSEKLKLGTRDWTCPNCHAHHDRDQNAARNILQQAL